MLVPKGAIVAVADGEKFNLFSNTGDEANPALTALPDADIESVNKGSGASHQSSSANPDESQSAEDGFAGGIADLLNKRVLEGEISDLIIIAAPRTLGELRKSYHKKLSEVLRGEIVRVTFDHGRSDSKRFRRFAAPRVEHCERRSCARIARIRRKHLLQSCKSQLAAP